MCSHARSACRGATASDLELVLLGAAGLGVASHRHGAHGIVGTAVVVGAAVVAAVVVGAAVKLDVQLADFSVSVGHNRRTESLKLYRTVHIFVILDVKCILKSK